LERPDRHTELLALLDVLDGHVQHALPQPNELRGGGNRGVFCIEFDRHGEPGERIVFLHDLADRVARIELQLIEFEPHALGNPSTRSAAMLRWISFVPA
jgi:hypothetical protein